ncbi:MAG TPA: A/G-specific adenine glycosylase [Candidatus Saccharimonadia bacterium]|nr:A/G-specific adenine glycosylase [Candidatus Saccharimonadia bacterium]
MDLTHHQQKQFLETLWSHYAAFGRTELPWRIPELTNSFDPYKIMVSELMLQQTQVGRVVTKYQEFLARFPTVHDLAQVELGEVLRIWQGLGYNRRAKYLWRAAQLVDNLKHFPETVPELVKLPGIGTNTAGAIAAYAYNSPVLFVETNIRTVYLHHFFADRTDVADKEILELLTQTLAHENPREFYWALMDYGTHLKATVGNLNKASKHYTKQSRFTGSHRQIRGQVIKLLGSDARTVTSLKDLIPDERLETVLDELMSEGMIRRNGSQYHL